MLQNLLRKKNVKYWVTIPRKRNYCSNGFIQLFRCIHLSHILLILCHRIDRGIHIHCSFLPWSLSFKEAQEQSFGLHWESTPFPTEMKLYLLVWLEKQSFRQESVFHCSQCENKQKRTMRILGKYQAMWSEVSEWRSFLFRSKKWG